MTRDVIPEPATASPAAERRRHARLKQKSLVSNLGPVMDLSRSGLRILTTRRRRGIVQIVLFDLTGRRVRLRCRVVWSKRIAFRKHLIGLALLGADESLSRELAKIGTTGFFDG